MEDLEDFEFGEMPDDDEDNAREEYDANNDDTFGGGIDAKYDADFSTYAEASNMLGRQFEDLWSTPGRSTDAPSAPDATNLPIPSFNFDDPFAPVRENPWDSGSNGLFNLNHWPSNDVTGKATAEPDETDVFLKYMEEAQAQRNAYERPDKNVQSSFSPLRPSDVKNENVYARNIDNKNGVIQTPSSNSYINKPLSAADLEQEMLDEARRKKENEKPLIHPTLMAMFQSQGESVKQPILQPVPTSESARSPSVHSMYPPNMDRQGHPGSLPPRPPMGGPQPPPWVYAIPPQFHQFIPIWLQFVMQRIPQLPPNVPPVHPAILQFVKSMPVPGGPRGPPPPFNGIPPQMRMFPPPPMMRGHPMPNNDGWRSRPMSSMSMHYRKPPGFPTGKTIEDFAFDPYAGFMSKKEREWLIKIQLLQSMGSGNPYLEDYYFTLWSQKQTRDGESINGDEAQSDEKKKRSRDLVPRNYNAPKFSGSLGKPVSSTTTNPRHLIDVSVHVEQEGDDKKPLGSQRKYKTILLTIENATTALLRCEDMKRSPSTAHDDEIKEIMDVITGTLFTASMISKILLIPKGRLLVQRFMQTVSSKYQMQAVIDLTDCASRFGSNARIGKDNIGTIEEEVIPYIVYAMVRWSRDELIEMTKQMETTGLIKELEDKNVLCRDILLSLLYACSLTKAHSSSSLFSFLKGPSNIDWMDFNPPSSSWRKACKINEEKVQYFCDWLRLLSHGSSHAAASLAISLFQ